MIYLSFGQLFWCLVAVSAISSGVTALVIFKFSSKKKEEVATA